MTTSPAAPLRVALFGTHPQQFNGYAKVMYELVGEMSKMPDIQLSVFGFQMAAPKGPVRGELPSNVAVFDAYANETPKQNGFGFGLVKTFLATARPDVVVIYNDLSIIGSVLKEIKDVPAPRAFKVVAYIDQVYPCLRRDLIQQVNLHADAGIAFTPRWRECVLAQGLTLPCYDLPHGLNPRTYFPIPHALARAYYGFDERDFLVLNLNRNQPRKRWDTCMKAWAEFVARLPDAPTKLIVGSLAKGKGCAWDILDIYCRELEKRSVPLKQGMRHLMFVDTPQAMSDREVNMLYNVCDVGLNTCDGEGFGLCNFEHAAVGKAQVVPAVGGFTDIFDAECAQLVDPIMALYLDNSRDAVGGEVQLCSYVGFADALQAYFEDPGLREAHGARARARILKGYRWPDIARRLRDVVRTTCGLTDTEPRQPEAGKESETGDEAAEPPVSTSPPLTMAQATDIISREEEEEDFSFPPIPPPPPKPADKADDVALLRRDVARLEKRMEELAAALAPPRAPSRAPHGARG